MSQNLINFLKQVGIFASLPENAIMQIAQALQQKRYGKDAVVIREGDPGDAMYIIANGQVKVYTENRELGIDFDITTMGPGEYFGEMSLLTGEPRSASVKTTTKTDLLMLPRKAFLQILAKVPNAAIAVSQELAKRLTQLNREQGVSFVNLAKYTFDSKLYGAFPRNSLETHKMIPLELSGNRLTVAMVDPSNVVALDEIRRIMPGVVITPVAISENDYKRFISKNVKPAIASGALSAGESLRKMRQEPSEIKYFSPYDPNKRENQKQSAAAVELLDYIMSYALNINASDVHIQPEGPSLSIRLRVDGRLRDLGESFPVSYTASLVSRIKILAGLDISERRLPQDGRFGLRYKDIEYDVRVATLPTKDGERVTLRILNPSASLLPLEQLFLADKMASLVRKMVFRSNGLILVTGPTGAGKTTTLYSALSERIRHTREFNIMTVEDPIEYSLPGIVQVQVNEPVGLGFPDVLRGFLRHDPEIIMVGEMRDSVTAKIAAQAALTGHLVLSSMHTIDSLGTIDRLYDMGLEPYLVANSLIGVISQRLVRRICPHCAVEHQYPTPVVNNLIKWGVIPEGTEPPKMYVGQGCDYCNGTGFAGRVGVYEILTVNSAIQELIIGEMPRTQRRAAAMKAGLVPFERYSYFLLKNRLTTPSEIIRILPKDE